MKALKDFIKQFDRPEIGRTKKVMIASMLTILLHPAFYALCTYIEEPYENPWLRVALVSAAIPMLFWHLIGPKIGIPIRTIFSFVMFLNTSVFIPWMFFMNGTLLWFGTYCAMIVMSFAVNNWLTSASVSLAGTVLAYGAAYMMHFAPPVSASSVGAVLFALAAGFWVTYVRKSNKEALQLNNNILMGILAHDLRTPIQTIELLSEALVNASPKTDVKAIATRLLMASRSMHTTIDDQIRNANMSIDDWSTDPISVGKVVTQAVQEYTDSQQAPFATKVEVLRDFKLYGSETQLKRVMINIIKNAHQAIARKGNKNGVIAVTVDSANDHGRIQISDTGSGISKADLEHIYRPFFSTAPSKSRGLGLYYVKHVVEDLMKGNIRTSSVLGEGTTVTMSFDLDSRTGANSTTFRATEY